VMYPQPVRQSGQSGSTILPLVWFHPASDEAVSSMDNQIRTHLRWKLKRSRREGRPAVLTRDEAEEVLRLLQEARELVGERDRRHQSELRWRQLAARLAADSSRADRFRALRDSGILPPKTLRAKERFRTAAALYVHLTSGKGPIFTPEHYERIEDTPPSQRPVPVSEDSITWAPVDQITAVGLVRRAFGLNSD
ncbi:MAG: hypothetical protein OEZ08_16110, partial [Betaproteobacteria bacterium]|nr:hypothetical protein [Betaproteobacteria bacterium]